MIHIDDAELRIDDLMRFFEGTESNFVLAGTWNKMPWRVWLHEPSDTLSPACWVLELGDHCYPLQQSSSWEQSESSKTWRQAKSSWRLKTRDVRWVPSLKDLGADLTID
jgi:hypothetical protein